DGMIEHDETIGSILKALDDLGIADNTIVVYSTDNGPHMNTWPDGAMTPFRSEKNTNWDGAFRVPCIVRWPGVIKPGTVTTELMSHNDWIPTFASIAGEPDITNKLLKGYNANGKTYKVHLDGFDQSNFLRGKTQKSARDKFFYTDDDGLLVGLREGDYKYVFAEQRLGGTMGVWAEPFTKLRLQKIFNLYQDPFERADITSNTFWDWQMNHVQLMYGAIQDVVVFAETFKEFPPRSIPPSFSAYTIMEEEMKAIKAQKYIEKNVMPKLKEEEAETKKKK
ncbi:sulfatase-like hydrolase/transferase, partial [Flavobacterium johnsoniae]